MTIEYQSGLLITGTASDRTGGTWTSLAAGWKFLETDTLRVYYYNGSSWVLLTGSKSFGMIRGWTSIPTGTNTVQYFNQVLGPSGTETALDFATTLGFTVTRFRVIVQTNAKNGNTIFSFRDDTVDVTGTPLTVGAATNGEFDSGVLSVAVAAGSKIVFRADCTASSSGAIVAECIAEVLYDLQ